MYSRLTPLISHWLIAGIIGSAMPAWCAQADDFRKLNVAYAGFALAGRHADLAANYPNTLAIEDAVSKKLYDQVKRLNPGQYDLIADNLMDVRDGDTVALALVIDRESVVVRKIGANFQVVLDIRATAVVFDFDIEEKAVIASYPVPFPTYIETYQKRPADQQIANLVSDYYFGGLDGLPDGLLQRFATLIEQLPIKQKYAREMGIGTVSAVAEVASSLPAHLHRDSPALHSYLADKFARELSDQQKISLLPYNADHALAVLSLRFTGTDDTVLLSLPEPDFVFDIRLVKLAKRLYDSKKSGQSFIYGARVEIALRDPYETAAEPPLFRHSLKHGVSDIVPATQSLHNDWPVYDDALTGVFRRFARNISQPDRKWLKQQDFDRAATRQLQHLDTLLAESR